MRAAEARAPGALAPSALPPLLGVVIVNFRGAGDTIECLESLLRSTLPMKVVVVENGSGDDSMERLRAWAAGQLDAAAESTEMSAFSAPPVAKPVPVTEIDAATAESGRAQVEPLTLIRSETNRGFAGGNNLGLRYLLGDPQLKHLWLLNNDTVVAPDAAMALLARMMATPRVGMCGTVVRHYWEPDRIQALNGSAFNLFTGASRSLGGEQPATIKYSPQDVADATDFVLGASLAVSRDFLTEVGFMEERYFLYFEEIDWAVRNRKLRGKAFETAFAHGANVFHKAGRSIGSGSARSTRNSFADYWLTRARLKFIWRHYPLLWPLHWLVSWGLVLRRLLRRRGANASAIARAALGRRF
ncbi:glycosyltransferase family 2 protein [Sandarakinorhabdus oryzae]|uniref:glycosyltransferase family 2 protein n=1 Tax=Sandarakinorhabdus oryzae TaxID=2675220 RepID=UPI0012E0DAF5|nr:glycosyltransferase family 2 protein [Sandarakinorhabdus oryzae]